LNDSMKRLRLATTNRLPAKGNALGRTPPSAPS
jgi:hypothetical protein